MVFFPIITSTFIAAILIAGHGQAQEEPEASLPTLYVYFQCGDSFNSSQSFGDIEWEEAIQAHYEDVLSDASFINATRNIQVDDRPCIDNDERQFRISVNGIAEFEGTSVTPSENDGNPSPSEIAEILGNRTEDLISALSIACFGDDIEAFTYEFDTGSDTDGNDLGSSSWNSRLCLSTRTDDGTSSSRRRAISTLVIVLIAVGVISCLAISCLLYCCCHVRSCICGKDRD